MFNQQLGSSPDFRASSEWLYNFKSRHRIRELEIHVEKLSVNRQERATSIVKFMSFTSSGTNRLPLLLTGKSKTPRAFKNVKSLPVS
jgi:hypothetical protein